MMEENCKVSSFGLSRVSIDPRCIIAYASYYIYGFTNIVGEKNIIFELIPELNIENIEDYRKGCAFILEYTDGSKRRLFIDTNDKNTIKKDCYEWSDVYAKINVTSEDLNKLHKLVAIGPSFGITLWNPVQTVYKCLKNYRLWQNNNFKLGFRTYLKDYIYMNVRREPYNIYNCTCNEDRNYVFTLSTLWYDNNTYNGTNRLRGIFARKAKQMYPQFEGGFFYIDSPDVLKEFPKYSEYLEEYKDMLIKKRISMSEYMKHIKKSAIVFNTPSVCGCHGWKLGEYLSMGKAIISTPLNNVMPGEFIDGVHYIVINSESEMERAIKRLIDDENLRLNLKKNAVDYFNKWLSPDAAVNNMLNHIK